METEKTSIIEDRIKMLHEAIRDEQATIFSIDWKARTLLMTNSIIVPLMLGIISFSSFKEEISRSFTPQNSIVLLLFVVSLLLVLALASVFYFTLKVIDPRIRLSEKIAYPDELALIQELDVYFPVFKGGKVDFGEYRKKLQGIEDRETIELLLLSELLSVSLIRDNKTKTLHRALTAMGINAVLILVAIFLFILLLL
jgi:hypothetical protein